MLTETKIQTKILANELRHWAWMHVLLRCSTQHTMDCQDAAVWFT